MIEQLNEGGPIPTSQSEIEPVTPPFKLCLSDRYLEFSNSQATNINLILRGYTTKIQIAEQRGLSPHTINKEFNSLYKNVLKIGNLYSEGNMSKTKLFLVLLKSGAVLQVPATQKEQIPDQTDHEHSRKTFKIKIQKIGDRYINPYRVVISSTYSELSAIQQRTIHQILSGRTTYRDIGNINGITENAAKKRVAATEDTQNSLRRIIVELLGKGNSQRLGNFEIFLKLLEYGILRQVPVEFNRVILDNKYQHDRF